MDHGDPTSHPAPPRDPDGRIERALHALGPGVAAWIFIGYEDERILGVLRPGHVTLWTSARARGKHTGDRVLFLQLGADLARWVGWGRVLDPKEHWKVFGVRVRCGGVVDPPFPVIDPAEAARVRKNDGRDGRPHLWEYRELGRALGLEDHRERTPYLDTRARDLRAGATDLAYLFRLQPRLVELGFLSSE